MDLDRDSSTSSSFNDNYQVQGPSIFGLIAAPSPLRTDFVPVASSNNTKFTLSITSPGILTVNELVFFLLPGAVNIFPSNSGALIYWQVEVSPTVQSGFELLGYLEPTNRQSDIFRTRWSEREEFIGLANQSVKVNIGISIEPMDVVSNLMDGAGGGDPSTIVNSTSIIPDTRSMVARKIAEDLFNFMESFDKGENTRNQMMMVPTNIFDRWMRRFENKLRRDPNFFLKNSE
jgi:hypothetical protein